MEFHFKKHNKPNRKNGIKICNPGTILFFQLHTFVHRIYIENLNMNAMNKVILLLIFSILTTTSMAQKRSNRQQDATN